MAKKSVKELYDGIIVKHPDNEYVYEGKYDNFNAPFTNELYPEKFDLTSNEATLAKLSIYRICDELREIQNNKAYFDNEIRIFE